MREETGREGRSHGKSDCKKSAFLEEEDERNEELRHSRILFRVPLKYILLKKGTL